MKTAMKAGEKDRLGVIRLINAAIKQREVDERIELDDAAGAGRAREDGQAAPRLGQPVRRRRPRGPGRDRARRDRVIERYLPAQHVARPRSRPSIDAAIAEAGAAGPADMGKLMGVLKPQLAGQADMGKVSALVEAPPRRRLIARTGASRSTPRGILSTDGPHPRRLHRRPARAHRHRRGDRRARAAEAPGQGILGALPVPRRALAVSFTVSPTKQFYHCFGCGAHGTAITFLMNYDRLEFLDAVEELAKRVGMEVPRDTQQRNAGPRHAATCTPRSTPRRSSSSKQLAGSDKAQAYLDGRGVDAENRERFGIGYAPDGFNALRDALGTDAAPHAAARTRRPVLEERQAATSTTSSATGVMFPIHDRRGRVIAFGGRVLEQGRRPEVPQLARDAAVPQGPRAVRPVAGAAGATARSRG